MNFVFKQCSDDIKPLFVLKTEMSSFILVSDVNVALLHGAYEWCYLTENSLSFV